MENKYIDPPQPKYEMMKKILTYKVEYADFGGEENFVKEEDVLAETFSEGDRILAKYLEGRDYHIISVCWKKMAIGEAAEQCVQADLPTARGGVSKCSKCRRFNCVCEQDTASR